MRRVVNRRWPVADFVRSLVRRLHYGQNSHELCYAVSAVQPGGRYALMTANRS